MIYTLQSIHSRLQVTLRHLVLLDHVHERSPAGEGVAVDGVEERLRDSLEQVVRLQVRLPQRLCHALNLLRCCPAADKVLGKVEAANQVGGGDERLVRAVQASDDGLDEPVAKASLVQRARDQVRERLGLYCALLLHLVQVETLPQLVLDRDHVRRQSCQSKVRLVGCLEDLLKVGSNRQRLVAETQVARDRDAVFPTHRTGGAAVKLHDRHDGWTCLALAARALQWLCELRSGPRSVRCSTPAAAAACGLCEVPM